MTTDMNSSWKRRRKAISQQCAQITFLKDAALKDLKDQVKPIFMYYRKSVLKKQIVGVNAPEIMKLLENI